jgi:predicted nuclease with RNAse H fold
MWIGADPGGNNNFGVAVLDDNGAAECWTVSSASEANEIVNFTPHGVGIDAPLWWSAGRGGGRAADRWLRQTYGIHPGTVQSANSLKGAALVQGAMLAELLRQRFPELNVTETHPKALIKAFQYADDELFSEYSVRANPKNEHERDAIVSALCARAGFTGSWPLDLSMERDLDEQDPKSYWLSPVYYWWPEAGPT